VKRIILIVTALSVILPIAALLGMRYWIAPNEGYPTWEAVRNMIVRDGEVVIEVPDEVTILRVECIRPEADVSINGRIATAKLGYSWSKITLDVKIRGRNHSWIFHPKKENNWDRISYQPVDPNDPFSNFTKIVNGVTKTHDDFSWQIISAGR
jgi:hypothetical protein